MNDKPAAIVPALNEETTIAGVLEVIVNSKFFGDIIVVDDASFDKTAEFAGKFDVRVISLPERVGKGMAMKKGLEATQAEVVVFFDADLVNLTKAHILLLLGPVLRNEAIMCTGEADHWSGMPYILTKIDPLLALSGQRAIKKLI